MYSKQSKTHFLWPKRVACVRTGKSPFSFQALVYVGSYPELQLNQKMEQKCILSLQGSYTIMIASVLSKWWNRISQLCSMPISKCNTFVCQGGPCKKSFLLQPLSTMSKSVLLKPDKLLLCDQYRPKIGRRACQYCIGTQIGGRWEITRLDFCSNNSIPLFDVSV